MGAKETNEQMIKSTVTQKEILALKIDFLRLALVFCDKAKIFKFLSFWYNCTLKINNVIDNKIVQVTKRYVPPKTKTKFVKL